MAYNYYPYQPNYFGSPYQQMPMQQPQQAVQPQTVQPQYTPSYATATVTVPCGCCATVSAAYVDGTEDDPATVPTPSVSVRRNAKITVKREA